MKIKLLKDIPGYKAGEILDDFVSAGVKHEGGFAEEIKDDIDIEEIRETQSMGAVDTVATYKGRKNITEEEVNFVTAYRIVKAVIEKLNGNWKPDYINNDEEKSFIYYKTRYENFGIMSHHKSQYTIIPACKDDDVAIRVIQLVRPELKVLFGVK